MPSVIVSTRSVKKTALCLKSKAVGYVCERRESYTEALSLQGAVRGRHFAVQSDICNPVRAKFCRGVSSRSRNQQDARTYTDASWNCFGAVNRRGPVRSVL